MNASSIVGDKTVNYDLQDGELWNEAIPSSLYLIDFDELLSNVSDENKDYNGYDTHNDQRAFLNTFYKKLAAYFPKEATESAE